MCYMIMQMRGQIKMHSYGIVNEKPEINNIFLQDLYHIRVM